MVSNLSLCEFNVLCLVIHPLDEVYSDYENAASIFLTDFNVNVCAHFYREWNEEFLLGMRLLRHM